MLPVATAHVHYFSIPFFPAALNIFQLAPHWLFQFLAVKFLEELSKSGKKHLLQLSKTKLFPLQYFFNGSLPQLVLPTACLR